MLEGVLHPRQLNTLLVERRLGSLPTIVLGGFVPGVAVASRTCRNSGRIWNALSMVACRSLPSTTSCARCSARP